MYQISDAEWEVMRVIWTKGLVKSSEIISVLGQKGWSDSTIKTLLGRLVEKGLVSNQRQGRAYLYQAVITEKQAYEAELDSLFSRICVTEHSGLVAYLLEKTPMTQIDTDQIEALLFQKRENLVENVVCNCLPGQCRCAHHGGTHYG